MTYSKEYRVVWRREATRFTALPPAREFAAAMTRDGFPSRIEVRDPRGKWDPIGTDESLASWKVER